ncbi:MAG: DUF3098 domain-containing protein [Saprospiraceae bacterium]|nr:DUF3098 domain-containing protein [Saprospiraceae bacterium]
MAKQAPRRPAPTPSQPKKTAPATPRRTEKQEGIFSVGKEEFIFDRQNFIFMGIGLGLVLLGLLAMSGGSMPDNNTWDPNIIYSFRRITLAPILMVVGFVVVAYGIFKKKTVVTIPVESDNPPAA